MKQEDDVFAAEKRQHMIRTIPFTCDAITSKELVICAKNAGRNCSPKHDHICLQTDQYREHYD